MFGKKNKQVSPATPEEVAALGQKHEVDAAKDKRSSVYDHFHSQEEAKKIADAKKRKKRYAVILSALLGMLGIMYIISMLITQWGDLVISIGDLYDGKTIMLCENADFEDGVNVKLNGGSVKEVTNITKDWLPDGLDTEKDGQHNGENYLASPIGVITNSMHGDKADSFDEGDLIICDYVGSGEKGKYKEGDVITFTQDISGTGTPVLVTHRIYKVNEDGTFLTKGDNNDTFDQNSGNSVVFPNIAPDNVLAEYHGTKIPALGGFFNMLQTPVGFFWCILFPMIIFFLYQAVRVVMNAMAYSREKGMEQARMAVENADLTEEQKQQAIAEYLASQKAKKEAGQLSSNDDSE